MIFKSLIRRSREALKQVRGKSFGTNKKNILIDSNDRISLIYFYQKIRGIKARMATKPIFWGWGEERKTFSGR